MTKELIKHLNKFKWEPWLERPLSPFVLSFFAGGTSQDIVKKIGFDTPVDSIIYQNGKWYMDQEIFRMMVPGIKRWLNNHKIVNLIEQNEDFYRESKEKIKQLIENPSDNEFAQVFEILQESAAYIWITHPFEIYFDERIAQEVPKFVKEDLFEFISAASFPTRKNAHTIMEDKILKGVDPAKIAKEFGWLRVRDGFSNPFTEEDIKNMNIQKINPQIKVKIPPELEKLFNEVKELVYFRTKRTDVFYHLLFLARPIIERLAKKINIPFKNMKNYSAKDLSKGKIEDHKDYFSFISHLGHSYFLKERVIKEKANTNLEEVKGNVAQKGYAKGIAKIVRFVKELDKVNEGDILITPMTFPSFIAAMHKAAAFVTDEGGLTCHAAIIAREMKKPCIIATKNATTVFKDNDLVEVDADKGLVRIIKRNERD